MFQYTQVVYIKSITQQNAVLFLFLSSSGIQKFHQDATLLALILHLSFFNWFAFFEFNILRQKSDNMLEEKVVLIRLKLKQYV